MRTKLSIALLLAALASTALLGCSARSGAGSADADRESAPAEPVESRTGEFDAAPRPAEPAAPRDVTEEELRARRAAEIQEQLQDVFFAFDSSQLTWEARQALAEDARILRGVPDLAVVVEGHCDERGTNEYNLALGDRRARSVRDYLVQAGVPAGQLTLISYGEERPFAFGHDEGAWSQNRRAHFRVR
jgi:peptidoglycan-associated lipoprotein